MVLYLFQLEELQNVPEKSQRELQKLEEKKNDLEVQDHRMPTISALQSYHEKFPACRLLLTLRHPTQGEQFHCFVKVNIVKQKCNIFIYFCSMYVFLQQGEKESRGRKISGSHGR